MPKQSAPSGRVGAPPALKAATQRGRCTAPPNTLKQTDVPPNNRAPPPPPTTPQGGSAPQARGGAPHPPHNAAARGGRAARPRQAF